MGCKYFIKKVNYGKYYRYDIKSAQGKQIQRLEDSGVRLFDSKSEAKEYIKKMN